MIGDGIVDIEIGSGTPVSLRPSLGAALALDRKYGGLGPLLAALESYRLGAAADVVQHAGGFTDRDREMVEAGVYMAGLIDLTPSLMRFVIVLANGGRALKEAAPEGGGPF